jgi:hypothetical protein
MIDEERGTKICHQVFLAERVGIEKDPSGVDKHSEMMPTGWLRSKSGCRSSEPGIFHAVTFRMRDDHPDFRPQVEAFLQRYLFASVRTIAKHFLIIASTVKGILQRELGMRQFSRRWIPHSLSDAQKVARVEGAKEMLKIVQESETNDFDGISTGEKLWLQHTTASPKMFARSAAYIIPRTRQAVGAKKLWSRCSSPQRNLLCSIFFQEVAFSISYISSIIYSPI